MHRLYGGKIKWILYLERRLTTIGMIEIPKFEEHFKQYGFEWMMRVPEKYSEALV